MTANFQQPGLEIEQVGDVTVVTFTSDTILDEMIIQRIGDELYGLLEKTDRPKLLLNFSRVNYLSSAMLAKLFGLLKKTDSAGGRVAFCLIDPGLYEIFRVTHLDRMLSIYRDEQEAIQSFQ